MTAAKNKELAEKGFKVELLLVPVFRNIQPTCLRVPVCVYAQADAQADEGKKR
jgi:hypothetical protein